ncbi:MAG TPA: hypothetical protein VIN70_05170 [Candidatus Limnocylindria bacterium]|jgi:hypothetical protein
MPADKSTARESDDLETAERKSKSVDERIPTSQDTDVVSEIELPGAIGRGGPLEADAPGPGEVVLEQESKAQRSPTARG